MVRSWSGSPCERYFIIFCVKCPLDIKTHYKLTETFQYSIIHKAKQWDCLEQTFQKKTFDESLANFKQRLEAHGYSKQDIERSLSEVNFDQGQSLNRR